MNKGTLTTLDFVISILREHEKEMTLLSDKLEEVLSRISNENMEKDMNKIHVVLNDLKQKIIILDQKAVNPKNLTIELLLKELVKQISIQAQNITLLLETIRNYPTKNELKELKISISSFNNLIKNCK